MGLFALKEALECGVESSASFCWREIHLNRVAVATHRSVALLRDKMLPLEDVSETHHTSPKLHTSPSLVNEYHKYHFLLLLSQTCQVNFKLPEIPPSCADTKEYCENYSLTLMSPKPIEYCKFPQTIRHHTLLSYCSLSEQVSAYL
jgi:hypothetical protein